MAESTKPRVVKSPPLPEAIDPSRTWTIKEPLMGGGPHTDYKTGVMTVPLAPTPDNRALRNREMLRVKFGPKSFPRLPEDVDPDIYKACENTRLDYRGHRLGVQCLDARRISDPQIEAMSKIWKDKPQAGAAVLMDAWHSNQDREAVFQKMRDQIDSGELTAPQVDKMVNAVYSATYYTSRGKAPGPKQAIRAAQILTQELVPPPPAPPESSGDGKTGPDGAEVAKQVQEGVDSMLRDHGEKRQAEQRIADVEYKHGDKPGMAPPSAFGNDWGDMKIFKPPRPLLFPSRMKSKKWRPTDQGSVFRYPHRWVADQTGFAYRGLKEGGCTMLIDVSGSMHLEQEDILTVMQYMPASLIATYSGRGYSGKLTIVGEKGRRAETHNLRTGGGGNVVDGPALRWLAGQRGPRYWVSDGYVVGVSGRTAGLVAECAMICRKNHIMRIDSMAEVISKFESYGKGA